MLKEITELKNSSREKIAKAESQAQLEILRLEYFGSKGSITKLTKGFAKVPANQRADAGKALNDLKKYVTDQLNARSLVLTSKVSDKEWFDVTAPGIKPEIGHLHPQTQVLHDLLDVFKSIGFQPAEGPEIENDWYDFKSLNFPDDHPARDTQQSLHVDTLGKLKPGEIILRTQTSSMQVRVMEKTQPPLRVIVPGKCYRYDQVDASHGFEFWQLEGFAVDKNITLTDLFGTISYVLKKIMGEETKLRFACTNFPFVEPGVDTYMECTVCRGKGCPFCKNSGWTEIMPAGMIHPNVLRAAKIDPEKWQGFAFAIGLSRAVNMKYGMEDLRLLVTPDLRLLKQF